MSSVRRGEATTDIQHLVSRTHQNGHGRYTAASILQCRTFESRPSLDCLTTAHNSGLRRLRPRRVQVSAM